ncbi:MAG: hypothetical protein JO318_07165 [Chloroflexi bacterium]|nr:hypothetical protein [Chloroflexota bacterium]
MVLFHGDYSMGSLVALGMDAVAPDWATLGWEPVSFDLAHLALSTGENPTPACMAATRSGHAADVANLGFQTALVIIGASRLRWMLSNGVDVPPWCVQFVCERDSL